MKVLTHKIINENSYKDLSLMNDVEEFMRTKPEICGSKKLTDNFFKFRSASYTWIVEQINKYSDECGSFLDFGCGRTPLAPYLLVAHGLGIFGYDDCSGVGDNYVREMWSKSELRFKTDLARIMERAYTVQYFLTEFNQHYDTIVSVSVLQHLDNLILTLKNIIAKSNISIHVIDFIPNNKNNLKPLFKYLGLWNEVRDLNDRAFIGVVIESGKGADINENFK